MSDEITPPEESQTPVTPEEVDPVDALIKEFQNSEQEIELEEVPFSIKKKDGTVVKYVVRELDGTKRKAYLTLQSGQAKVSKGEISGFGDVGSAEVKLVSMSVWGSNGMPVKDSEVLSWGSKLIGKIAKIAGRISGLDNKAEARAKNS
jgi:hypothetical protein